MDAGSGLYPARVGRYWLFRPFARGGMASIHLGRLLGPARFSRLVAMKVLHPLWSDREHYEMLLDEARLSARVRHPNVVQTLDVVHDSERVCIVMEYVHGVDLAAAEIAAARAGERIPTNVASAILVGVLQGLHAAHEARDEQERPLGLVHRDVSPHNVVVGLDGVSRVLDFGVAKALRKDHVTAEGVVKGKVAYMPPEQLTGRGVTRQADLYAAGVVLWEMLTGRRLFDGGDDKAALVARVLGQEVLAPSTFAEDVGAELDAVVLRAVAIEARDRFATAQEMAVALAEAAPPATSEEVARWLERVAAEAIEGRVARVREVEAFVPDLATDATAGVVRDTPAERAPAKPRGVWKGAVAIASVAAAAAVFALARAPRAPQSTAPVEAATRAATIDVVASPPADSVADAIGSVPAIVVNPPIELSAPAKAAARTQRRHEPPRSKRGVDCDPPYTIDSDGLKHYKLACLP